MEGTVMDLETSASTEKIDAALAKVQGELQVAAKDKVNPHFRSKYADISALWDAARPALAKYAVSVTQWPIHAGDGRLHLITRVAHAGEWMRGHFSIPVTKDDPQGYGSAVTYAKRFAFAAALGLVASDEDDDGNAASESPAPRMAESKFADHMAAIETAADLDSLEKAYRAATAAAGRDGATAAKIVVATKTRKAAIESKGGERKSA